MKKSVLLLFALLIGTHSLADEPTDPVVQLAQNGVVSSDASGQEQTTVVDTGGNLKMVPTEEMPKSSSGKKKSKPSKINQGPGMPNQYDPSLNSQVMPEAQSAPSKDERESNGGPASQSDQQAAPPSQADQQKALPPNDAPNNATGSALSH